MCRGFGAIVTMDMRIYFCEPDDSGDCSHSIILGRADINEDRTWFSRRFVRIECLDWTTGSFCFDEDDTLPWWVEENKHQIMNMVANKLDQIQRKVDAKRLGELIQREYELDREYMDSLRSRSLVARAKSWFRSSDKILEELSGCRALIKEQSFLVGTAMRSVAGYVQPRWEQQS